MTQPQQDEVHVWTDRTEGSDQTDFLNDEERARADRFKVEAPRRQFIAARASLRRQLGEYLKCDPRKIEFVTSEHGKPALANEELQFNVSHTEGQIALAFAHSPVGIDVERFDRDLDHAGLAERFFSEQEQRQMEAMNDAERKRAFFRCWTQKEAYLKALGSGLTRDTRSFAVDCRDGEAGLLADEREPEAPNQWWLRHLDSDVVDYSVSLATAISITKVSCFTGAR